MRHTYNAVAIRAEVGLVERAGLLNHSDTHTLKTYDHHLEGLHDAREAVRAAMREIRG